MQAHKNTLLGGAVLGFLAVALGAFGAHALKSILAETGKAETFELAVRYHFYHAIALLFLGIYRKQNDSPPLKWAARSWMGGVLLFCGSLYIFSTTRIVAFAMITPIGGVLLLAGWLCVVAAVLRRVDAP